MKPRFLRGIAAASALLAFAGLFVAGCQQSQQPASQATKPQELYSLKATAVRESGATDKIRVATFNIANLSLNKLAKEDVASALVRIVRQYDVVAVQELDDASGNAPQAFLDAINKVPGDRYAMVFSEESGLDATPSEKEQYAIYYNTKSIAAAGTSRLYPDQQTKLFVREPFAAPLRVKSSGLTFVVLTIHTDPDLAPAEIAALRTASDWAAGAYEGEEGVVILGDFNAGKRYVKPAKIQEIRSQKLPYLWVVPDDADTTLGAEPQAHDRIVITSTLGGRFTGRWGVDRSFEDKRISDHYPVWMELKAR